MMQTSVPDPVERYARTLERTPEQESTPWTPLQAPLASCRFALVTTGGVHRRDQQPFDVEHDGQDWSYREIPSETPAADLMVTHNHYNHEHVDRDINAMYPIDRFRELAAAGTIAGLGPRGFGLYGYIQNPQALAEQTAPRIAAALHEDGVDAAFLTPG